jgi:dTDP-glucose 4,6-dehydratase
MDSLKKILVTGGAGFIGSNFIRYALEKNPRWQFVNLDRLTYAACPDNLADIPQNGRYSFIHGDICDAELVADLFSRQDFDGVFHFAAESHVDNSILGPAEFVRTNVVGTFNLIEQIRKVKRRLRFVHVSTDEVYGTLGDTGFFSEESRYSPRSPYSASKAASDLLVKSYFHTYGLDMVVTNCSNNYGPRQHSEKLIPTVIRKALQGEKIPIYGNGLNIRDWLHVEDHCRALDAVFRLGRSGESYNIGGHHELRNIDIADMICTNLNKLIPRADGKSYQEQIGFVEDRLGHDYRYAIDPTKTEQQLAWKPTIKFEDGLRETVEWYVSRHE